MRLEIEKINVDQFFQMRGKELEEDVVDKYNPDSALQNVV